MKESLVQKEKNKSVIVQPKAAKTRLVRTSRKQATPSQVTWTEESERLLIEIKPNALYQDLPQSRLTPQRQLRLRLR